MHLTSAHRTSGLSTRGTAEDQVHRLLAVDAYINSESRPAVSGTAPHATAPPQSTTPMFQAPAAPAEGPGPDSMEVKAEPAVEDVKPAQPMSRWTTVDEEEEKQHLPQVGWVVTLDKDTLSTRHVQVCIGAAEGLAAAQGFRGRTYWVVCCA